MTSERETSRDIDDQAAAWIARRDRGPLSDGEAAALDAWLAGDSRRRGAMLRADAVSMLSESASALGPQFDPQRFAPGEPRTITRRKMLGWAGGGCAIAASAATLGIVLPAAGAIHTDLGEVRLVTLDDGSTVMLNTSTSVRVRYTDRERRVELLEGEAFFTAIRGARPFVVDARDNRLSTFSAAFRIRALDAAPVDILVDRGGLALRGPGIAAPVTMRPGSRLILPASGISARRPAPRIVDPNLLSRELAWREGKIAFEGERLDEAAAAFARYSNTRIEIADPALAREPVTGLFAAGDPAGFGRAVATVFGARVEQRGNLVRLYRAAPQQ
ncbi:FecR domain-containing protein [Sphingopyxis sp.]|uniref:FecR family protein n=1 Tax=Sphingopyxis sp. TaxID=1908224 RepID=UPI0025DCD58B|nr:FecR domain-containing protein [Sphingopyxis sp.]